MWTRSVAKGAGALLFALTLAACGNSNSNPIGPSNQPEIANATDNFQFQASSLSATTQTLTYTWTDTGPAATLNVSGQITSGGGTLTLRDAAGKQVFSGALTSTGTFASTSGTAGSWQIVVQLTNVTGSVNFRVQRSG